MKKIALLADGWKRLITYAWVEGINRYVEKNHLDVAIYHFNCLGSWSKDDLYNRGEYTIYTLPDLREFDGIILDANNIVDKMQYERLVNRIRESHVPAVSIGRFVEGLYFAGVDNAEAIERILNHVYTEHGARSFVYAGGPRENGENEMRAQAFRDFLEEKNLAPEKNPVWYGNFELSAGVDYFESVINHNLPIPDAFICGNDNIAAGIIYTAQKNGYRIPEDFIVTGFDNLDKATYFEPQITTVGHERESISETCMQILTSLWAGKPVAQINHIKAQSYFSESCGCSICTKLNYRNIVKNTVIEKIDKQEYDEELVWFESRLTGAENFSEIFECIGEYFRKLSCDGITLVMDERLFDAESENVFRTEQFDESHLVVAYTDETFAQEENGSYLEYKKKLTEHANGNVYMFTPIHSRDCVYGFSILKNGRFLYDNPYFYGVHNTINRVVGELYRKIQLKRVNAKLSELYNKDPLTGIYNRIAYNDMVEPMYEEACKEGKSCLVLFADCDHFKQINDTLGHEAGDQVLKDVGRILRKAGGEKGKAFRYGGDEFVLFMPDVSVVEANNIKEKVMDAFADKKIEISVGMVLTDSTKKRTMDDYMREADKGMYENKRGKREAASSKK